MYNIKKHSNLMRDAKWTWIILTSYRICPFEYGLCVSTKYFPVVQMMVLQC